MATSRYTDNEIKNIGNRPLRESLGRGNGSVLFKKRKVNIEAYYIYSFNNSESLIKISNFKHGSLAGLSSKEIRLRAKEYSELREEHPDLKGYFEYVEQQKILDDKIEACTGSFKEMLENYIGSLNNPNTKRNVISIFRHDVYEPFPELLNRKPSEIQEAEIILILKKLFDRGVTTNANRLRSYLSSAFSQAIKATNDPLKQDKMFNVQRNPVLNIPKQSQFEKVIERSLTREEAKHLLLNINNTYGVSSIVAGAIKFLFYIGGQRPLQTLAVTWLGYDYRKKTISIIDTKGRNSHREYVTPLTAKAIAILDGLNTQELKYPFTTNGNVPIRTETLLKAINKYCRQYEVEKFTLRDIRRTCKNLMIDAGIGRETRNLIQNHGLTGIDYKHYDKSDHLPEKLKGMAKYDRFLDSIIEGQTDNIVQLMA